MADDIEKLRKEIDALNDELAVLVQRRAGLAQRIGALKGGAGYRSEREAAILRRVAKTNSGPLGAEPMLAVFREIISACRALEEPTRRLGGHQAVWRGARNGVFTAYVRSERAVRP
jgi:chorismate mutase/prephenate dehydratase